MPMKGTQVLAQHQDIDFKADRLRLLAHAPEAALRPGRARQVVERELRALLEGIESHFQYEEHEGYMTGVLRQAPQLGDSVEALRGEHGRLRGTMEMLRDLSFEDGGYEGFQKAILAFLDELRHHEEAENDILRRCLEP